MSNVLLKGSTAAVLLYMVIGIFGYLTFLGHEEDLGTNILMAAYKPFNNNVAIIIVRNINSFTFRATSLS